MNRKPQTLGIAAAATLALSGVAYGQTGGAVAPGGGTTPPPTTPTDPGTPAPTTPTSPSGPTQVFPIPTKHTYGDGFGASRNHKGADVFAPCRATGCHLHLEIWKGKWYRGGFALDPLPTLRPLGRLLLS